VYVEGRIETRDWTSVAAAGWVGISVVLARIFPTWVLPMFYRTSSITDESLVARLLALCERARLRALGVFRVDLGVETRKANAALAGVGRTRRVLVSDTLLERFSPEEIETVLAHELGHQRHRHISKMLLLSGLGSWAAFAVVDLTSAWWTSRLGVQGLADPAGFPMLLLSLFLIGLVGLPLQNALSRRFEWQADRFAVTLTHQPPAFAEALRKLGELNLADPAPPRWIEWLFYDHPAIHRRIRAAEAAG
jgi:STE24 endopeptidase